MKVKMEGGRDAKIGIMSSLSFSFLEPLTQWEGKVMALILTSGWPLFTTLALITEEKVNKF